MKSQKGFVDLLAIAIVAAFAFAFGASAERVTKPETVSQIKTQQAACAAKLETASVTVQK